jgi:SAM-dependent methyltransferase
MRKFIKKIINHLSQSYYYKRQADSKFAPIIYYSPRFKNIVSRTIISFLPLFLRKRFSKLEINPRIFEEPFIFQNINLKKGSKILDIGCCDSKISLQLSTLGYKVTGIDLRNYGYFHPNFKFIKGNFLENQFPDDYFDYVIAISTIEHIGLDAYGGSLIKDGDKKTVKEIYRILKKRGKFLLTLPFGKKKITKNQRIYDSDSLGDLLRDFRVEKEEYYKAEEDMNYWIPVEKEDLSSLDYRNEVQGIALLSCQKI